MKKNKAIIVTLTVTLMFAVLTLIMPEMAIANDEVQSAPSYAFKIESQADKKMRVEFVGNQMYHDGRYIGYGISGKPMLTLRYMAEWFGFQVDNLAQNRTVLVSSGEYSFQIKPDSNIAEIYWAGEKIKEYELTEQPFIMNGRTYLYSLDISALLGLMTNWDNDARIWDVSYRDYSYQELGFPATVNDDKLTIKGVLYAYAQYEMPILEIWDTVNNVPAYTGHISSIDFAANTKPRYELSSTIKMQGKNNSLQVRLSMGQRIHFVKDIEVVANIEDKGLVVKQPAYQFSNPTKGYVKVDQPEIIISGSVADNNDYPSEIVVCVKKVDNPEIMFEEKIPIIDGQFKSKLGLKDGEGLYKVTVNSIMAGPRGPAYLEITNFFVELISPHN